jgi:integrase
MASLFKDKRGYWYLQFYDRDKLPTRKKVALHTKKKTEATAWKSRREKEFILGQFDPWGPPIFERSLTLSEVAEAYFKERPELRPKSCEAYRGVAAGMESMLEVDMLIQHVSIGSLREYIYDSTVSAATRRHRFGHLRSLFGWAIKRKLILENPFSDLSSPKNETRVPRFLAFDEFTTFIRFIEQHIESLYASNKARDGQLKWLPVLIQLAVFTGLRRGELVSLDWNDVDFEEGYILVRNKTGFKTKSGNERAVPLISQAHDLLEAWKNQRTVSPQDPVFLGQAGSD